MCGFDGPAIGTWPINPNCGVCGSAAKGACDQPRISPSLSSSRAFFLDGSFCPYAFEDSEDEGVGSDRFRGDGSVTMTRGVLAGGDNVMSADNDYIIYQPRNVDETGGGNVQVIEPS